MPRSDQLYYVYIVASISRTLYIGVTSAIEARMEQHRNGTYDGFTKRYRCHRLVHLEHFAYIHNAISREKELKSWLRAKKVALIARDNPTWVDMSADWGKPVPSFSMNATPNKKQVLRSAQDDNSFG